MNLTILNSTSGENFVCFTKIKIWSSEKLENLLSCCKYPSFQKSDLVFQGSFASTVRVPERKVNMQNLEWVVKL